MKQKMIIIKLPSEYNSNINNSFNEFTPRQRMEKLLFK